MRASFGQRTRGGAQRRRRDDPDGTAILSRPRGESSGSGRAAPGRLAEHAASCDRGRTVVACWLRRARGVNRSKPSRWVLRGSERLVGKVDENVPGSANLRRRASSLAGKGRRKPKVSDHDNRRPCVL